jgi:integrase
MLQLPNGCRCSGIPGDSEKKIADELSVKPKNWKSAKAPVKKPWYIQYRFYDPSPDFKKEHPTGLLVIAKGGINNFKTAIERRSATRLLMAEILFMLQKEGYNPWKKVIAGSENGTKALSPNTLIIEAMEIAQKEIKTCVGDIKSVLKYTIPAIIECRFQYLQVSEFRRRHMRIVLDHVKKSKQLAATQKPKPGQQKANTWSANTFNYYRAHLQMVFEKLIEYDVIEANPLDKIKKEKYITPEREVLTTEERAFVNSYLKASKYTFWRFLQIFFHSGARETEMMRVQGKHVDLEKQRFKVEIRKKQTVKWVWKTIKTIALPLWKEAIEGAGPEDYIFAKGLKPGPIAIDSSQITRRWRVHIKKPFGITKDFYSLKASNLDEISEELGVTAAQKAADHETNVITLKHYLPGEPLRVHEALKKVGNKFA